MSLQWLNETHTRLNFHGQVLEQFQFAQLGLTPQILDSMPIDDYIKPQNKVDGDELAELLVTKGALTRAEADVLKQSRARDIST